MVEFVLFSVIVSVDVVVGVLVGMRFMVFVLLLR